MTTDISVAVRWDPVNQQELDDYDYDGGNSSSRLFERSRIKALADEREAVQKKTFCKWVNSHLVRANCRITDLYTDLRDGKMLIKLLEILSGERLPKPTKGKMRIHCLENVDKALQFLKDQRVHLENLGSHDIVDGNPRLTLGLIWTIILRFQIQDITIEEVDNQETKSAKDALLLWCQMKTAGYPNVNIRNFTTSWRDGLAFNAIIHKHRPDLVQYDKLSKSNAIYNLNNAFSTAEENLGITRLLDAEDVYVESPDEKSIITYVVTYYHYFSKMKAETVQGRRIGKVVGLAMENDQLIDEYETLTTDLLQWIEQTILALSDRKFANSLTGVQQQLTAFNNYRTTEKPPKFTEKGNLEVLLFTIQSKMRANNQNPYFPKEGQKIVDINKAWERLEKAEHERELALREELIRQEKLEQLAARFDRKAGMRETWLSENQRLVSQDNFGFDLASVEAAAKKHEAIETDIYAYEERVQAVVAVAQELETENYHDIDRINARKDNVLRLWNYLLELLRARRSRLEKSMALQQTFQEMIFILDSMEEIKARLLSEDYGKHLMGVEDLLQKHSLVEADINVLGERVKAVVQHSQKFITEEEHGYRPCDPKIVTERINQLEAAYSELVHLALERRNRLDESRKLWQFYWDMTEEETYIKEKEQILSSDEIGHDLTTVHLLISKNKAMEDEISSHEQQLHDVIQVGEDLVAANHFGSDRIRDRIGEVNSMWDHLKDLLAMRKQRLYDAVDYHQFFADADDVDTWMLDALRLVSSEDVGRDEANVQSLLKKHKDVTDELKNYANTIDALHTQASSLGEKDREAPEVLERLASIDRRYKDLVELAKLRKQRLLDALSLYKLFNEADGVEQWIEEKEKMIDSMVMSRDMEDIEVMRHRFEGFEQEMNANATRMAVVNQLARQLLHVEHPNSEEILARQNQLNKRWSTLQEVADQKKEEINSGHGVQTFHIECKETITWIEEKTKLLQATEELGNDLTGIMTLQRRLSGMERDLAAIQAKLDSLEQEADKIQGDHPEEAEAIRERITQIKTVWEQLTQLLKDRDSKLEEAGDLHRFLRDLDHFQAWLTKTQTDVASEDIPSSLSEAEKLLSQHQQIRDEIDNYTEDYNSMMEYGEKVTQDQTDAQYMFLRERLKSLQDGWTELHQMWENRQQLLSQSLNLQMFMRDAKQAEVILNQQEHYLSKDETPTNLEQAEDLIKRHETYLATMEANDEKINAVVLFAQRLCDEGNFDADKVHKKAENITERRNANHARAAELMEKLKDQLMLHHFLQDCEELNEWIQEKSIIAQDETYRSAKTIHSKWMRHQAFAAEVASNKNRLYQVEQAGRDLMAEKPELASLIEPRLNEIAHQFEDLENTTSEKGEKLFDANRQVLYEQTCDDIDGWISELETQVLSAEPGQDVISLTGVNLILQKQQMIETQMAVKAQQVTELKSQADYLRKMDPEKEDEIVVKKSYVEDRRNANHARAAELMEKLKDQLMLHHFLQDCEELNEWIQEKSIIAQDETYRSAKTIHSKWMRHQAFAAEVASNKNRLYQVEQAGRDLMAEKPELASLIEPRLNEIAHQFEDLENTTSEKGEKLFDANRQVLYEQTCDDIDGWISELETQVLSAEPGQDVISLTGVNLILQKQQMIETQMAVKAQQVTELKSQADYLRKMDPEKEDEIVVKKSYVEDRFQRLQAPLLERKAMLLKKKEAYQFRRDIEDEKLWISEKMPLTKSTDYGNSLFSVQMLKKKNQSLRTEIENHEPRIMNICENGQKLISEGHEDSGEFQRLIDDLLQQWQDLKHALDVREDKLLESEKAQQYYFDASEAEAWMSEQELYMMVEDRGKDEISTQNLKKKHESLENAVEDYAETVRQLGETAKQLASEGHPESDQIIVRQSQVDKLYAGLKDLALERRAKLDEGLKLFSLNREVDDIMQWIADREMVAGSHELGQDYDHVVMLQERFKEFARDTEVIGTERVAEVNEAADQLIASGHSDSAVIAEWKDTLNEAWADLLELIDTRTQMLAASWKLHRFFHDCKDLLGRILEKQNSMSDELGKDGVSVSILQRKHANFENDLQTLGTAVQQIQEESESLQSAYAGDKAKEITNQEGEVVGAWQKLLNMVEGRRLKLADTNDLFRFLNMVRDLMLWMEDIVRQMNTSEKPRDVSGVELLMNNHQSLKAEIDAREDNINACVNLGKELLARNHYASNEIKERLLSLTNQRTSMMNRWEERWEHLQLILEVYQFARDAAVAEAWLVAQEPYLLSQELGHTIDDVEQLIKKHEAFEKSAAAQEERFAALERMTTFELKEFRRKEEEEAERKRQEELARLAALEPPPQDVPPSDRVDGEKSPEKEALSVSGEAEVTQEATTSTRSGLPQESQSAPSKKGSPTATSSDEEVQCEGLLGRKQEWESTTKRASSRSWDKMYIVLQGSKLFAYKDQRHYKQEPENYYRNEVPIDLRGATAQVPLDYTKRKHVFRLKLSNGAEYLFQAKDDDEMNLWLQKLQAAIGSEGSAGPSRSQTLPAGDKKDEHKKRGFFTLKKNDINLPRVDYSSLFQNSRNRRSQKIAMEDDQLHDSMHAKLPAEKASIEAILTTMESTVTSDGLLHIANCVEANLSNAIAQPHHSDESTQYIVDLQEIMEEVRSRYVQTREKEIDMESSRLKDRLNQWGISQRADTQFTPVKGKNKTRKSAESQAAKKPRTDNYTNRFSSLAIEEDEGDNEMDAGEITPMPSPTKSEAENPSPTIINNEDFPPLHSKPVPTRAKPKSNETPIEDPFSVLRSEKCQTLYKEMQEFVHIANNIPTKAGRMAALFKFIEEED
ncbi:spectrin beta chain [Nephila pilipes]|uniref:Spectrin beta chain, non-erythrocytic 2 n=1 Tax=Nephila pilipes TaxID=299642 RepID=A0A8X6N8J2_NEPPI|nr:spectrin beta chain [Nephila pilipes]